MFNTYYLVEKDTGNLVSPYKYYNWTKPIIAANQFSVTIVSTVVAEDLDGIFRGKNDILILSRSSLGQQPLVERIHFFEKEIETGKPITNLLSNSAYVSDDYNGSDRLYIELNVVEVDTDLGERKAAVSAFQSLATTAGAVFPAIIPYAYGSSAVVGVVNKLVTALEKDKNVIKIPISLHPGSAKRGYSPLQEGTYVVFAKPQDPTGIKLGDNGLLDSEQDISNLSYVAFDVYTENRVSPDFVVSQKLATLLTQLRDGSKISAKSSIEFVEDTIRGYSNYRKLERFLELKDKEDKTDEENELMNEIKEIDELKPFIPTA